MPAVTCDWGLFGRPSDARRHVQRSNLRKRNRHRRHRHRDQDRQQSCPIAEPASAYGVIGKTEDALLQKDQCEGGIKRPQDQLRYL